MYYVEIKLILCMFLISTVACDVLSKDVFNSFKDVSRENPKRLSNSDLAKSFVYNDNICDVQLQSLVSGLGAFEPWALQVIDSWGNIGLLQENYQDLGTFDECIGVLKESSGDNDVLINGQYCVATMSVTDIKKTMTMKQRPIADPIINAVNVNTSLRMPMGSGMFPIRVGACIPNACSPEYFLTLISNFTQSVIVENLPMEVLIKFLSIENCQQKCEANFTVLDKLSICFFTFIGCLLIISTIYDVWMSYIEKLKNPILIAFSVYTNGEQLFKCSRSKSENVMDCLNGIRVLSIVWVILFHTYIFHINMDDEPEWRQEYFSQLILSGTVSVDSFFLLSGLLVCWSLLRSLDQKNGKVNIFQMYFHRYLRLTPAFAAAILFYVTIFRYIGSDPFWNKKMNRRCTKWWWSALLYVQNYVNVKEMCFTHSWYLSADMQLFISSPLFIYPMWRWKLKFVPVVILAIVLSSAYAFYICIVNEYNAGIILTRNREKLFTIYYPTIPRMGVWIIGVLLGYMLHRLKGRVLRLPTLLIAIGWIVSLGTIFAILFGPYNFNRNPDNATVLEGAFYDVFSRITWGLALSWIIFACVHRYGGPVNWFLSWPQWQPVARLSYSFYILHVPIIAWITTFTKTSTYFDNVTIIHHFWGHFGFTLTLAVLWVMAFESPILALEKLLLRGGGKPKP